MKTIFSNLVLGGFVIAAACGVTGCSDNEHPGRRAAVSEANRTVDDNEVLARVDGVPITLGDVSDFLEEVDHAVSPTEALDRMIEQELLAREARRRGYAGHADVIDEQSKALARVILERRIDESTTPQSLDQRKLRAYYETKKGMYVHGLKRKVAHLLIATGKKKGPAEPEARQAAHDIAEAAGKVADIDAFEALAKEFSERLGFAVKYESLPPFPADSEMFMREFVNAAFAVPRNQTTSGAIQTSYGWHVIYVAHDQEVPALNRSFEEVKDELAAEVLGAEKRMRYKDLVQSLARGSEVVVVEGDVAGE